MIDRLTSIIGGNSFISIILYSKFCISRVRSYGFKEIIDTTNNENKFDNN